MPNNLSYNKISAFFSFSFFSLLFFFSFYFFSLSFFSFLFEHWSKLEVLALILILLLVFSRLSCITQHGYHQGFCTHTHSSIGVDWMHIYYLKGWINTINLNNLCCKSTYFVLANTSLRSGAKRALDWLKFKNSQHGAIN